VQYGVTALASAHWALLAHETTHAWVVVLQTSPLEQFVFDVHCTQRLVFVLQTGVAPVQALESAAVHCTQVSTPPP
jgi:hypothetical protein